MKKYLLIILALILFGWPNDVLASNQQLISDPQLAELGFTGYQSINPNSLLYQFKRIGEQVAKNLTPDEKKKSFEIALLDKRFKELVYIINSQKTGFLKETVERYNSSAGAIKSQGDKLSDQARRYLKVLEKLRDQYPANSSHWLSVQQTIDVTRSLE